MIAPLKAGLWQQFGATIDYLADTTAACPDDYWQARLWTTEGEAPELSQFWYRVYHTLFWLHLYLYGSEEGFHPRPPFGLIEQDEHGPIPERAYTKDELLDYLYEGREKCRATIEALTEEKLQQRCAFPWGEASYFELLIYNLRHVQEHAGQLNLFLGQHLGPQPDYVIKARNEPPAPK